MFHSELGLNPFKRTAHQTADRPGVKAVASQFFDEAGSEIADLLVEAEETREAAVEPEPILFTKEEQHLFEQSIREELVVAERHALQEFFGQDIPVPPLPPEITVERIEKWKQQRFGLHYLPEMAILEKNGALISCPGWIRPPEELFLKELRNGRLLKESGQLSGCWILVDERPMPNPTATHVEEYETDVLGSVIEQLRMEGILKGSSKTTQSRFNLSYEELRKPEALKAFADVLDVDAKKIGLPKAVEFNLLGNLHYPQWGSTRLNEFFCDRRGSSHILYGGSYLLGGIASIGGAITNTGRGSEIGFRLVVRFF